MVVGGRPAPLGEKEVLHLRPLRRPQSESMCEVKVKGSQFGFGIRMLS